MDLIQGEHPEILAWIGEEYRKSGFQRKFPFPFVCVCLIPQQHESVFIKQDLSVSAFWSRRAELMILQDVWIPELTKRRTKTGSSQDQVTQCRLLSGAFIIVLVINQRLYRRYALYSDRSSHSVCVSEAWRVSTLWMQIWFVRRIPDMLLGVVFHAKWQTRLVSLGLLVDNSLILSYI